MRSNTTIVRNKVRDHISEYFNKDNGWDSDDVIANIKSQLKSFDHMPNTYSKAAYMVDGGTFLVYHTDVTEFILSLDLNFSDREYDNMKQWELYKHLVAREIEKMVA